MNLLSDEDVARGVVNEDGTACVLLLQVFLAEGVLQLSSCGAHKVVN